MKLLHLYAQDHWHDEAFIVGTREALLTLRAAIDQALETGRLGFTSNNSCVFADDGEGYQVIVLCVPEERRQELTLPYTDKGLGNWDEVGVHPGHLLTKEEVDQITKRD